MILYLYNQVKKPILKISNKQSTIKRKGGCICKMISFCCKKPAQLQSYLSNCKYSETLQTIHANMELIFS